jgi:uracil-DNA glycosylase family 4
VGIVRGTVEGANCIECPFAYNGQPSGPVPGEGPGDPTILVVGEGPGVDERKAGRPFVGKSGRLLNDILKIAGAPRDTVYCTNATLCLPSYNATDKAKEKAAKCCKPRLAKELSQFPGKPILALGNVSAQILAPSKFSISDRVGTYSIINIDGTGDRYVIPSFHPAFILHSEGEQDLQYYAIAYDAAKVIRLARGEVTVEEPKIETEKESPERAAELVRGILGEAKRTGVLGLDTETTGKIRDIVDIDGKTVSHQHDAREAAMCDINAIGLATEERAICVPWVLMSTESKELLKEALLDETIIIVLHNSLYDRPVLHWHGFEIKAEIVDTMLLHHAAFPGLSHKLQRVASQFFLVKSWKSEYRAKKDQDLGHHLEYCGKDTLFTTKLRGPLLKCIKGKAERVAEVDRRMAEIAFKMHVRGIPVSRKINRELGERLLPTINEKKSRLMHFFDDPDKREIFIERLAMEMAKMKRDSKSWTDPDQYQERVELRKEEITKEFEKKKFKFSPGYFQHVSSYLLACGIPLKKLTKKGGISTDREVLEGFGHVSEVRDILDYRSVEKLYGTFIKPIPTFLDENDFLHPNWKVNKNTGRWSADRPPCQNITEGEESEGIPNIRTQYEAPDGYVFVGADKDKFELRIIAMYSRDPYMLSAINDGVDVHSEIASLALPGFDQLEGDSRKNARKLAKNVEYGWFYKAQPITILRTIHQDRKFSHVKLADVFEMVKILERKFTGVKAWHNHLFKQVAVKKELKISIDGRFWKFPLGITDPNLIVNWGVQSFAASDFNEGFDTLDRRLVSEIGGPEEAIPVIQLHDGGYVLCREKYANVVAKMTEESLTTDHCHEGQWMHFPAKAKIGKSWAEVS